MSIPLQVLSSLGADFDGNWHYCYHYDSSNALPHYIGNSVVDAYKLLGRAKALLPIYDTFSDIFIFRGNIGEEIQKQVKRWSMVK